MVRRVPTPIMAMKMAMAPVRIAVEPDSAKLCTTCEVVTPPYTIVVRKIGRPATSSMITKYSRLISEPKTIWALESGVARRILNV